LKKKKDQPLFQNILHEFEYRPDVCRGTNEASIELL